MMLEQLAISEIRDKFSKTNHTEKDYQEYLIELWNVCQKTESPIMEFTALIANEMHSAWYILGKERSDYEHLRTRLEFQTSRESTKIEELYDKMEKLEETIYELEYRLDYIEGISKRR